MSFTIFQNKKKAFLDFKKKKFKKAKIDIFPNGFGPKMAIFPAFFLQAIQARKISLRYSTTKNAFQTIKRTSSKSRKIDIFPKGLTHGFGPKMADFPTFFFRQYRPGKYLYDILQRKNAFLDYKKKTFKKSKNWHLTKGVNPWFWSKNGHFSNLFSLGNIGQQNVFQYILER